MKRGRTWRTFCFCIGIHNLIYYFNVVRKMGIIGLKEADCRSCYRCLKVCPVKSIKFTDEQARILDTDCLLCGSCINECPQGAKTLHSDLPEVRRQIKMGRQVIAAIAPSFFSDFPVDSDGKIAGALQRLGFYGTAQVSYAAAYVSREYYRLAQQGEMKNILTTCCPVINDLVEKYYPDMVPYLAPVQSPMVVCGELIKRQFGPDAVTVFIGPCIAKKGESTDIRHNTQIDYVLNFGDLAQWFSEEQIDVSACEEAEFLRPHAEIMRLYPVSGGIIKTVKALGPVDKYDFSGVDGIDECKEVFESIRAGEIEHCFIELNACKGGCVNGPARGNMGANRFTGSIKLKKHVAKTGTAYPETTGEPDIHKMFLGREDKKNIPDEATIRAILRKIGKETKAQELNCGSCGYPTCRDKAIAVYQGKAELTMCVPYMRQRAESLSNTVMTQTPNITIIADSDLNIVEFNPAAERAFGITRAQALQKGLYEILDTQDFLGVFDTQNDVTDKKIELPRYGLILMMSIVYIPENNMVMGVFKDITQEERRRADMVKLRDDTVSMAQNVIEKQMVVAQEIASLLGETTAETKVTLTKLKKMLESDGE